MAATQILDVMAAMTKTQLDQIEEFKRRMRIASNLYLIAERRAYGRAMARPAGT